MLLTAGVFGKNLTDQALVAILGGILLAVSIWTIFKRRLCLCYFYEMITTPSAVVYLALFNVGIICMTAMVANGGFLVFIRTDESCRTFRARSLASV